MKSNKFIANANSIFLIGRGRVRAGNKINKNIDDILRHLGPEQKMLIVYFLDDEEAQHAAWDYFEGKPGVPLGISLNLAKTKGLPERAALLDSCFDDLLDFDVLIFIMGREDGALFSSGLSFACGKQLDVPLALIADSAAVFREDEFVIIDPEKM